MKPERLYMQRDGNRLIPYSEAVLEKMAGIGQFEVVEVAIKAQRNTKFNALYRALLSYTAKALKAGGEEKTSDDLHKLIKIYAGYYRFVRMPDYIVEKTGRDFEIEYISTQFSKMTETAFKEFVEKAVTIIETKICPYLAQSDYAAQVDRIIAEFRK